MRANILQQSSESTSYPHLPTQKTSRTRKRRRGSPSSHLPITQKTRRTRKRTRGSPPSHLQTQKTRRTRNRTRGSLPLHLPNTEDEEDTEENEGFPSVTLTNTEDEEDSEENEGVRLRHADVPDTHRRESHDVKVVAGQDTVSNIRFVQQLKWEDISK